MITGIDHIVIAVADLPKAMETYGNLGFSVVEGGRHPYGSYNALIAFADGSYIEIISFYEDSPAHPWWALLHERGGGLVDFCMATDDIRGDLAAMRAQGVDCGALTEGGRARPDGYQVKWLNNKVGGHWQGLIPFIIEDLTPRDERLPGQRQHANGATGINSLRLAAHDPSRYADVMAAATGLECQPVSDESAGASGLSLEIGGHRLEYLAPSREDGPLAAHLAANRPAPFAVSFTTTGAREYGPDETLGVRMALT